MIVCGDAPGRGAQARGPARQGGNGVPNSDRLFYSDLVLDRLRRAATTGAVLAAGDLNEARDRSSTRAVSVSTGQTTTANFSLVRS